MIKKFKALVLLFGLNSLLISSPSSSFKHFTVDTLPENMSVATKKERFYKLLTPPIHKVYTELNNEFIRVQSNAKNHRRQTELKNLRTAFKVDSNEKLLLAMKPHPPSIVIAQAAMESAWGTSRFFREANNVFGMWSKNKNEPRIAAGIKRNGNYTVWLRKFNSIEDSVRAYYRLMARGKHFKEFRKTRYATDDVFEIVKKLDKYSEIGHLYGEELSAMIRFNKLQKYDK